MEAYPWWSDEQKALSKEVESFVNEQIPKAEGAWWERRFPWEVVREVAKKGYFGAGVPKEYGGLGQGATGACIIAEQVGRLYCVGHIYVVSMLGGLHQLLHHGTEEQKKRWLTELAKGEKLGAVCITEPLIGSDAAAIETVARKEGDGYIITGKKRFITGAGVASRYLVYARTSDDPKSIEAYRHLSAFIVERGTKGFTLEKINELIGFDNVPNGYLSFDEAYVPEENRIGREGMGWSVLVGGLNFERAIASAVGHGGMWDVIRQVVYYMDRRIQFGRPTSHLLTNQFKVADMIVRYKLSRLMTFYTAYLVDLGREPAVESAISKLFHTDSCMQIGIDAVQCMGGDGATKFYPVERMIRESKIGQIVAGTNEIMKLLIYRMGLAAMSKELKIPFQRKIDEKFGVPMVEVKKPGKQEITEENMLKMLAEDYRVNPGIYMSMDDIRFLTGGERKRIEEVLSILEEKKLAKVYRDRRGRVSLAKATYEGLRKANPPEYYRWFPGWFAKEDIF